MKRTIFIYLFILILSSTIVFGIVTAVNTQNLFGKIIENNKEDVFAQIKDRIRTYDKILYFIEKAIVEYGDTAILQIAAELNNPQKRLNSTSESLRELADKYGVNEIYLIRNDGVITRTSFLPDQDFNLFSISDEYEEFVAGIFGKGEVFSSKLTTSEKTGIINNYLYYSPPGADYIVEISIKVGDFLMNNYSEEFYRNLIDEYFSIMLKENQYLEFLDIYQISELTRWSLINEGKTFSLDSLQVAELNASGEISKVRGYNYKIFRSFDLDSENFDWFHHHVIEVEFDFSTLAVYKDKMILALAISAMAVIMLFFILSSQVFNVQFIKRVMVIDNAIKEIEKENYDIEISLAGNDELNHIARHVQDMAASIKKRINTLEEFIPICANCKDVRNDEGYWQAVEAYISERTASHFSHGLCPKCMSELYPDFIPKDKKSGD